ncbi:uncharacterized protein LOC141679415 [Apium graveolens]|uniref:uncharacterized protein LOC141679415 n=1 Tax=Apium graveolens TaxID=4045 RepID=UPI003D79F839
MTDLHLIALCNVLYKILAKVLANRLKVILPGIICENQSAFMPGRNITDNVLMAFEIIHHIKRKHSGGVGEVAPKLDMSKSYDRVDWDFLNARMHQMGPIKPKQGLRQGDPLSPYLFLFCVEGLSRAINQAEESSYIHGCKSRVFFSSNVRRDKQVEIMNMFGVANDLSTGNYLGLPSLVGKSKTDVFSFLKDRIWKRVHSSSSTTTKGIRWMAWEGLSNTKVKRGLGFRSLYGYNLAMLGKHVWNFIHKPHSLVARVFKARNNIPVRSTLQRRHIMVPLICPICITDEEHLRYVFFDCEFASQCWQYEGLSFNMGEVEDVSTWLLNKLASESQDQVTKVAMILWAIWFFHNKKVWDEKSVTPGFAVD